MTVFTRRYFALTRGLAVIIILGLMSPLASADTRYDDSAALKGLQVAKGVFLIDFTSPQKTAFYLDIIKGTHDGLLRQGVEPDMVLVFIGPTVQFLSTQPGDELQMEYGEQLEAIARTADVLKKSGVRMEVCAVATKVFDIDNQTILPSMNLVGDGFISLIGWQSQGYKLVPIF